MSVSLSRNEFNMVDPLERVEQALEEGGWQAERDEEGTIQAVAETRSYHRRVGAYLERIGLRRDRIERLPLCFWF